MTDFSGHYLNCPNFLVFEPHKFENARKVYFQKGQLLRLLSVTFLNEETTNYTQADRRINGLNDSTLNVILKVPLKELRAFKKHFHLLKGSSNTQ